MGDPLLLLTAGRAGFMHFSARFPLSLYSPSLVCRFLKGITLPSLGLKDSFNEFDEAV